MMFTFRTRWRAEEGTRGDFPKLMRLIANFRVHEIEL